MKLEHVKSAIQAAELFIKEAKSLMRQAEEAKRKRADPNHKFWVSDPDSQSGMVRHQIHVLSKQLVRMRRGENP